MTAAACILSLTSTAQARDRTTWRDYSPQATSGSFVVIGDLPYGQAAIDALPGAIAAINADRDVSTVVHLGDIKNGSTPCSNEYFDFVRRSFDTFTDPLVYTPGDNEWADCHRPAMGAYDPLERLAAIRSTFFRRPSATLGRHPMRVTSQAQYGLAENVRFERYGLAFAALHVVGSNDDLGPWNGVDSSVTRPNARQIAEQASRMRRTIQLMQETFAAARLRNDRAVVLLMQADMFAPGLSQQGSTAFRPLVRELTRQAARFDGPVYLFNGDSHAYASDRPLAAGSRWLDFYRIPRSAGNLQRVTIDGAENTGRGYLKVSVAPAGTGRPVLRWARTPYIWQ